MSVTYNYMSYFLSILTLTSFLLTNISSAQLVRDFRVNDDTTNRLQRRALIGAADNGNFIIVWNDIGASFYDSKDYFRRYNASGKQIGHSILLQTVPQSHAFTVRRDGNYIVGWAFWPAMESWRKPQCQRYNNQNQKIGNIINIPRTAPDTAKYFCDFVIVGDKIISVWEDTRAGDMTPDIYCNILSFTKPDSVVGVTNISTEIPKEYKLYQNYPNPFN